MNAFRGRSFRLFLLGLLLQALVSVGAWAQTCDIFIDGVNIGNSTQISTTVDVPYAPQGTKAFVFGWTCTGNSTLIRTRYRVQFTDTGNSGQKLKSPASGTPDLDYFLHNPVLGGSSSCAVTGDTQWGTSVTTAPIRAETHAYSLGSCIRMISANPVISLNANSPYTDSFRLVLLKCTGTSGCTPATVVVTVNVNLSANVPKVCTSSSTQSLSMVYQSHQTNAAAATGISCITCNPEYTPTISKVRVNPAAAVVLGLRYTVGITGVAPVSAGACNSGIRIDYSAQIPGGQAGRCTSGTCTDSKVHQLEIEY
jgi:hypothetical protein